MLSHRHLPCATIIAPDLTRRKTLIAVTAAFTSCVFFNHTSFAAETINLDPIAVTGNPSGVGSDNLVTPVSVLNGRELSLRRESTLGEMLNGLPGVSANQFGPNASRPVIRGLDSERVRMLQNGTGILDASSLSFDHAVGVDPLIIEQIDVIRGPAALLYGGSAVGGVVNAIDHRIPTEQLDGIVGRTEVRFGGPADTKSGVAVIDVGNEQFAIHVDGFNRKTNDLDIPGFAVSKRKNTAEGTARDNKGKLANSDSEQDGAALGTSLTFDNGYIGISYAILNNNYGTTFTEDGEPIRIDMESKRWDIASEFTDLGGFINRTKVKLSHTDYAHMELEGSEVGTTFENSGWQGTFELGHLPLANLTGTVGYQFVDTDFSAAGEEAFVPNVSTQSHALYVYEELPIDAHKITFGARFGRDEIDAETGISKRFNPTSYAFGGIYQLSNAWSVAANLSHNERAPSYFELFAEGVHVATDQFERGNVNLSKEKSNGIDAQLRWKQGRNSFSIGAYATRFNNFIALINTGDTFVDGAETYDINAFRAVPALFKGLELEGKWQATESIGLNIRADYVLARDKRNNDYLPRISPARLGIGADYTKDNFSAHFDVLHALKQNKTAANELATNSYTNVSTMAAYKLPISQFNVELFAKANNLLNEEIRDHTSFLKDVSPSGERSLQIGARADF